MPTNRAEARKQILSIKSELDSTYDRYHQALGDIDIALHGDLHKYMCIRLAGYLEQLMFEAVTGYVSSSTGGPAGQFAMSWFKRSPNLTPDALITLIGRFGEKWEEDIRNFLDTEERKNNLGKLLEVRNKVAHGKSYSGGKMNVATYKELIDSVHTWVLSRMVD
ncbi:HEPN domain-containing protein [Streptomyces hydrogenans]|uniref:HEPN domain-containing protein n=1 Tax=Streptomyces hydrogenans TaxID=1873719 RepID=UPI003827B157